MIVQPYGSSLGQGYRGRHKVEGIGVDNPTQAPILDQTLIDRMVVVQDADAQVPLKALARTEGMLVGGSAGAAAHAARQIADDIAAGRLVASGGNVVTLFPDGLERYMSKHILGTFDEWTA